MKIILKGIFAILISSILITLSVFLNTPKLYDIEQELSIVKRPPLEEEILEQMSLEERVGQLFVFGFSGSEVSENITDLIQENHISGVLLLGTNIVNNTQLSKLITDIQEISKLPLLITIDQEGGIVARLKGNEILTIAQKQMSTPQQAYDIAKERGEQLITVGVNVNLAPVVEYITSSNSFMYHRVFRGTKEDVAQKAEAAIKGYTDSNTISVAKHYPGHSDSSPDSHYSLPKVYIKNSQWDEYIYPFKYLIEKKVVDVIMVGHIFYPNIDSKTSTISSEILNTRLREQLGFQGVLITDDMEMDSIEKQGNYTEIAKQALLAGNDILLYSGIPKVQREVYEYILQSVKNGEIPETTINEKVLRVLRLKIKYGLIDYTNLQFAE